MFPFLSLHSSPFQMNMMANAGPYGGPYGQSAGQGMPGAGLGPQLQNKAAMPNNIANQFNMDKKTPPGQGMPGMVSSKKSPLQTALHRKRVLARARCGFSSVQSKLHKDEPIGWKAFLNCSKTKWGKKKKISCPRKKSERQAHRYRYFTAVTYCAKK